MNVWQARPFIRQPTLLAFCPEYCCNTICDWLSLYHALLHKGKRLLFLINLRWLAAICLTVSTVCVCVCVCVFVCWSDQACLLLQGPGESFCGQKTSRLLDTRHYRKREKCHSETSKSQSEQGTAEIRELCATSQRVETSSQEKPMAPGKGLPHSLSRPTLGGCASSRLGPRLPPWLVQEDSGLLRDASREENW